jgi:hypothetical protein
LEDASNSRTVARRPLSAKLAALAGLAAPAQPEPATGAALAVLSEAVKAVRDGRDQGAIGDGPPDGDLSDLIVGFNEMLEAIRARDAAAAARVTELESAISDGAQALKLAKEATEAARRATRDFRAAVGDEIRAPVRGVATIAAMLAAEDPAPRKSASPGSSLGRERV